VPKRCASTMMLKRDVTLPGDTPKWTADPEGARGPHFSTFGEL